MKEIIKYETDENGEHACLECHATGETTLMLVGRLILNMVKMTEGEWTVKDLMEMLEKDYIPKLFIMTQNDETVYEEVIDPE